MVQHHSNMNTQQNEFFFPHQLPTPIGILGWGVEGQSTYQYLISHGVSDIFVFDRKAPENFNSIYKGSGEVENALLPCKTIFRSPGIRPDTLALKKFIAEGGYLTSQTDWFFQTYPRQFIIGVTGTLGKGSCCALLHHILTNNSTPAILAGNFGIPFLSLPFYQPQFNNDNSIPYIIAELSSFQLSTVTKSPHLAIILQTTSEHLDWHTSTSEYRRAKARLVEFQRATDTTVYFADSEGSTEIANFSCGERLPFGSKGQFAIDHDHIIYTSLPVHHRESPEHKSDLNTITINEIPGLSGNFQLQNVAAAATIAEKIGLSFNQIKRVLPNYHGLEHRFEYIGCTNAFKFYNDSYATRPEATLGVLATLQNKPLGLILGGSEKGADFSELAMAIALRQQPTVITLIGQTANRMLTDIVEASKKAGKIFATKIYTSEANPLTNSNASISNELVLFTCPNLPEAIDTITSTLDTCVIVLSPACASFGLFANYKERGKIFKTLVHEKFPDLNNTKNIA